MNAFTRRSVLRLLASGVIATAGAPAVAADGPPMAPSKPLHAMFDARWEALMKAYPPWATFVGDHRYGDRLDDASPEAIAANQAATRRTLTEARAIDRNTLSPLDRASLDVFIFQLEDEVRFQPFVGYRSMSLGALDGFQSAFASLLQASPVDTVAKVRQILARMEASPRRVDQELALLREGMALGWVPPKTVLDRVLPQIDDQLNNALDKSPFFEPFTRLPSGMAAADKDALRQQARVAIETHVLPSMRRLRAFVADEYLPKAAANGALADRFRTTAETRDRVSAQRHEHAGRQLRITALGHRRAQHTQRRHERHRRLLAVELQRDRLHAVDEACV